jgi:hypothetical protein
MPELTVLVPVGGREVEMRKPSDGALVVLARVARGLPKIENDGEMADELRERLIRNLGTLGQVVEQMIVKDDDKNWLDDAMISDAVSAEEVFEAIRYAGEKFNGQAATAAKKAQPPVRRRR